MQIEIIVDRPHFESEEERRDILQKKYKNVQKALFQSKMERKKKAGIDNGEGSI